MKKSLFIFLLILFTFHLFTQDMSEMQVIGRAEFQPDELISHSKIDESGNQCAGILIITDLTGLTFQSYNGVVDVNTRPGRYFVFVSPDERVVEIYKSGYKPLKIILNEYGVGRLKSGETWKLEITGEKKIEELPINIITSPPGADIYLDGDYKGTSQTIQAEIGKHTLKVQKEGYRTKEQEINVSTNNILFNIELEEIEQVMITIKSVPTGAAIYLNNDEIGKTNKQPFRFPGNYYLRLVKNKYETIDTTIIVTETGNNIFSYYLEKSTVMLTISINPSDADIYLNNEKLTGNIQEISPGKHKIEVRKTGYFSQTRTIDVQKGKDITESFTLKKKTGKLQFVAEPMEANVTLKKDGNTIDNWKGSKMKSNLQIGEYRITASLTGYESKTKKCTIELNKTAQVSITLEPEIRIGSDSQLDPDFQGSTDGMVFVQGGTFQMGSNDGDSDEKPVHSVTVDDFYIGKYEVTQKEWKEVMGNNTSKWKGDDLPVEKVSWYDAVEFCNKKSDMEGLTRCYTGSGKNTKCNFSANGYRLPTEAEWEYAGRGGSRTAHYKYSGSNNVGDVAWYYSNSSSKTHKVGTKQANELGIYDMSGNVWEWCNDWYDADYYKNSPKNNPQGDSLGKYRVLRGGSWSNFDYNCRVAYRFWNNPDDSDCNYGFRLSRTP